MTFPAGCTDTAAATVPRVGAAPQVKEYISLAPVKVTLHVVPALVTVKSLESCPTSPEPTGMFSKAVFKSAALPVFVIFAVAVVPPIIGDQSPIVYAPAAANVAAGVNVPAGD